MRADPVGMWLRRNFALFHSSHFELPFSRIDGHVAPAQSDGLRVVWTATS